MPDRPAPPPPRGTGAIYVAADAFMVGMFSRPASGSLRTTWVTPATLWLCAATVAAGLALGILLLTGGSLLRVGLGIICLVLVVGALSVLLVAALQRWRSPG